ncbi:MAG: hypothetical protein DRN29_11150 [Thermoplasmata archaeon]|nr:MAG: hypothetical protein DRN29_11150 [Thermoplasmata archaeon]
MDVSSMTTISDILSAILFSSILPNFCNHFQMAVLLLFRKCELPWQHLLEITCIDKETRYRELFPLEFFLL